MGQLYSKALPRLGGVGFSADALALIAEYADGDGRRFLNLAEQVDNAAKSQRMIDGGGDARHICRRLIAIASEDIGNADPAALQIAMSAAMAFDRMGHPEGELAVAHATVYLASAPKSNAVYAAWNAAKDFVKRDASREVPLHLRNATTKLMEEMGYKEGYRYAHDEPDAYAAGQTYFPESVGPRRFYEPTSHGIEKKIADRLARLAEMDREHGEKRAGKP